MNAIVTILFWCVIQVTILAGAACVLHLATRRFGPRLGAWIATSALMLIILVSIGSLSPWPSWLRASSTDTSKRPGPIVKSQSIQLADDAGKSVAPSIPTRNAPPLVANAPTSSALQAAAAAFWKALQEAAPQPQTRSTSISASLLIPGILFGFVALGFIRLLVGLSSVKAYLVQSQPIEDPSLLELLDMIAAEVGCTQRIGLRESSRLPGPATIGWRKPLILLPPSWRSWDDNDRRTIIAHEVAHIRHRDYLTWLLAQVGVALHFYHPLAHWLSRALRLDQELAADALAGKLVGGQQTYLASLARIALQQPNTAVSWPARTFLPTRRTFLRRIEMLRDSKQSPGHSPRIPRAVVTLVLVVVGLAVMGLRSPRMLPLASAQQPKPQPAAPAAPNELSLAYVPRDTFVLVRVQVSDLIQNKALAPLHGTPDFKESIKRMMNVDVDTVGAVQIGMLPLSPSAAPPIFIIASFRDEQSAQTYFGQFEAKGAKVPYAGQAYIRHDSRHFYFRVDPRSVLVTEDEGVMRRCIVAGSAGATSAKWAATWSDLAKHDLAALVDTTVVRQLLHDQSQNRALQNGRRPTPAEAMHSQLLAFAPLWEKTVLATLSLDVSESAIIQIITESTTDQDAQQVASTIQAVSTLARNLCSHARQTASRSNDAAAPLILGSLDVVDELLENLKIQQTETRVTAETGSGSEDIGKIVSTLLPAVEAARQQAAHQVSVHNLKQLGLAFHNYHATFGTHFPPAVFYGPNEVPRSWRVELLPYLGLSDLYKQYRTDEPWDSENNRKVLQRMPDVYRHPQDVAGSTNSSYFVITGPGTMFDSPKGTTLATVHDGLSFTLMVVEAKRSIPWTKPEDISYVPDGELPKVGGWEQGTFLAALADGSVRGFRDTPDGKTLRLLITKSDGMPIPDLQ